MTEPYEYWDNDGEKLVIGTAGPVSGITVSTPGSIVVIAAHQLAGVVTGMYRAAGLPVPDLPGIPDPADVKRLALLIHFARHGTHARAAADDAEARVLLAHGVTMPEATP